MRIVLVGASGFFGRYVLNALVSDGHRCLVLTRAAGRHSDIVMLPGVELVQADVYDADALAARFEGADAVVSMAGILNESGGRGKGFHKVHVEIVKAIIEGCNQAGVSRILHVSALHAGKGSSHYLKSKGEAEILLNKVAGLNVTVFQPSVIFARGDSFFNRFAGMLKLSWIMPLACPRAVLQPVYAVDVAKAMVAALDDPMTWGKSYELGGPRSYTLKQLVEWTAETMGVKRWVIGLPKPVSAMMAMVMGLIPGKPFSMDNYRSLQTDNITDKNGFKYFGIAPRSLETVVPDYLNGSVQQQRLQACREQTRRNG